MKCTQCGCKKLIKSWVPFSVNGDAKLEFTQTLKVYVCSECGHLEWFVPSIVDDYKNKVSQLESSIVQSNKAKEQLLNLENMMSQYDRDVKSVEKELKSLDITVRRQRELQSKLQSLRLKISNSTAEITTLKQEVIRLENLVESLNREFSNNVITEK